MENQKLSILKIGDEDIATLKDFSIDVENLILHIDIDAPISPKLEKIISFFLQLQTSKRNDIFIHQNKNIYKFYQAVTVMADFGNIDYSLNERLTVKADVRYDCVFLNDEVFMNNGAHLRLKHLC